jgi:uncharacterized protein
MDDLTVKVLRPGIDLRLAARDIFIDLKTRLSGRVDSAFIFGSLCTGTATADSDIDLLLVAQTTRPFLERWRDFGDLLDGEYAIDLLVYTPHEFATLTQNPTTGFWKSFVESNQRLI